MSKLLNCMIIELQVITKEIITKENFLKIKLGHLFPQIKWKNKDNFGMKWLNKHNCKNQYPLKSQKPVILQEVAETGDKLRVN